MLRARATCLSSGRERRSMVESVSQPPRNPFFRRLLVMKRTPVVLAFFLAAFLLGLYVTFQSPKTETFTMATELGAPVPRAGVQPIEEGGSGPGKVDPAPYRILEDENLFDFDENKKGPECCPSAFVSDEGCICVTEEQKKLFASRGTNGQNRV